MFVAEPTVESRTYLHVSNDASINVVRHREEDEEDMFSVRFGDENFVLEFGEGLLPRLIQILEDNRLRHAHRQGGEAAQDQVVLVAQRAGQ